MYSHVYLPLSLSLSLCICLFHQMHVHGLSNSRYYQHARLFCSLFFFFNETRMSLFFPVDTLLRSEIDKNMDHGSWGSKGAMVATHKLINYWRVDRRMVYAPYISLVIVLCLLWMDTKKKKSGKHGIVATESCSFLFAPHSLVFACSVLAVFMVQ